LLFVAKMGLWIYIDNIKYKLNSNMLYTVFLEIIPPSGLKNCPLYEEGLFEDET